MTRSRHVAVLLILLGLVGLALYLGAPLLTKPQQLTYADALAELKPLTRLAPADASHVVLVPRAASTYWALRRHDVTAQPVRRLEDSARLRALPWLLGNTGVVVWMRRGEVGAASAPDPLRHFLVRIAGAPMGVRVHEGLALVGATQGGFAPPSESPSLVGHVFVVHNRREQRGVPPVELPAISVVTIGEKIQLLTLGVRAQRSPTLTKAEVRLPQAAMLAAAFAAAPLLVQRAEQTLPVEISGLLEGGGVVALYELQDERFLPRPRGVLILPVNDRSFDLLRRRLEALSPKLPFGIADQSRRDVVGQTVVRRESFGFTLEYTRRGDELLVAFDRTSLERFLADTVRSVAIPAGTVEWFIRFDPRQLVPALERLREHAGLHVLLPELARPLDDFREAVQWIEQSSEVFAMKRDNGEAAVLEVTISPPK